MYRKSLKSLNIVDRFLGSLYWSHWEYSFLCVSSAL